MNGITTISIKCDLTELSPLFKTKYTHEIYIDQIAISAMHCHFDKKNLFMDIDILLDKLMTQTVYLKSIGKVSTGCLYFVFSMLLA